MRPGQHNKRGRGRNRRHNGGGGGGGGGNPLNRVYESNGPDVKVRGTAQTVADKYLQLGRDAQVSGDTVMAESYYQHAEHYLRILAAAQAYQQQMQQQYRRPEDDYGDDEEMEAGAEGDDSQPEIGNERPGFVQDAGDQQDGFDPGPERRDYQQNHRDNRDYQQGRSQEQQHQGRDRNDRNRFRPRWENRRDQREGGEQGRYNSQQSQPPHQAKREEQPQAQPQPQPQQVEAEQPRLPMAEPAPPAPAAEVNGAAEKWDGPQPSFLKRPATRTRKPRATKEKAASAEDAS